MTLESKIEAILFWKGEPMSRKDLAKALGVRTTEIDSALKNLTESLTGRGLALVEKGDEVMLYTAPEASELVKKLAKDEMAREISKAALEVLSLIMYRGPISKRDIDYIRGVNSSYIIRNLMIRGLIERNDGRDGRSFVYQGSFDLLAHLGIKKKEDLAGFAEVQKDIATFMTSEQVTGQAEQPAADQENHGN